MQHSGNFRLSAPSAMQLSDEMWIYSQKQLENAGLKYVICQKNIVSLQHTVMQLRNSKCHNRCFAPYIVDSQLL